jgi:hypothetical protein
MPIHRTSSSVTRGGSAVAVALLASTRFEDPCVQQRSETWYLHVLSAAREFSHPFERVTVPLVRTWFCNPRHFDQDHFT